MQRYAPRRFVCGFCTVPPFDRILATRVQSSDICSLPGGSRPCCFCQKTLSGQEPITNLFVALLSVATIGHSWGKEKWHVSLGHKVVVLGDLVETDQKAATVFVWASTLKDCRQERLSVGMKVPFLYWTTKSCSRRVAWRWFSIFVWRWPSFSKCLWSVN